ADDHHIEFHRIAFYLFHLLLLPHSAVGDLPPTSTVIKTVVCFLPDSMIGIIVDSGHPLDMD
ncbi:hypothetical protein, partial [uncultured Halomonas sp.]|uniref:hypothetical protein n=1 Tax=uncultured Halomonas sp. TaxID=173971 RepID=UPI00261EC815